MIKAIPFGTTARTVDHLGREQIADCPTAISELWKNAYDAYACNVELHIFDGNESVAAIFDDGHGMNYEEFVTRWLVVGTDSKYTNTDISEEDRNGLEFRVKQGQKGIGRLSSANLGPLLLVVSKRRNSDFVAALVDWRIFENPYLLLSDIKIPVTEFSEKSELFSQLPQLFELLTQNVWGDGDDRERQDRIELAWKLFDELTINEDPDASKPSEAVANTIINARFDERHIDPWPVWQEAVESGTALLVSEINFDLKAQLSSVIGDTAAKSAKDNFFQTLSSFVDPLFDPASPEVNGTDPQLNYRVRSWHGSEYEELISTDKQYSRKETLGMEHVLEGTIDAEGVFHGQVKAFGEWRETGATYVINPPKDLKIPKGKGTRVGPIDIHIATFEQERRNTSHTDQEYQQFSDLADLYSGLMIYRNGLRVLPYGRVDSDFFQIEMRRSINAGREFWNARRIFGRLAISREHNPNLKDKAGREGFIDNAAVKTLRALIVNILRQPAYQYFGSNSEIRKPTLDELKKQYKERKAAEEKAKLRKSQRKKFRTNLRKHNKTIPALLQGARDRISNTRIQQEDDILEAEHWLGGFRTEVSALRLPGVPSKLGTLEDEYRDYRTSMSEFSEIMKGLEQDIEEAVLRIKPPRPEELFEKQLKSKEAQLTNRTRRWRREIEDLQGFEKTRVASLISERNKIFRTLGSPLLEHLKAGDITLQTALRQLEELRQQIDEENVDLFEAYIQALEFLKESIDLEVIASHGAAENDELRAELDRLNGLAQLGIAVEILDHELQSYDDMISEGLRTLPSELQESAATESIRLGYEGLTRQLAFLSPLKLSGHRIQRYISGKEIFEYLLSFFERVLNGNRIDLRASSSFEKFRVYEQPSRLFPVFINLVNNSIYWLSTQDSDERIVLLDVVDGHVIVSDNGPGVDELDTPSLFKLFFTKKLRSGRGVGLYLSRVNLAAGGHKVEYVTEKKNMPLEGANFAIDFRGAEYDDQ